MKMEEHEIFSHFEFEDQRWAVKLELDYTHEHAELVIEATDILSASVSAARWKAERLATNAEMKFIFPTLEQLFYYLAHHSKSLQISQNSIQFVVTLGEGMKNRKIPFSIGLEKKEMKKEDLSELKIKLLENRLEKELRIRDEQIKALQKAVEVLNNRLESNPPKQSKQPSAIKSPSLQPHPYNPDNACFTFSAGAKGLRVKRVNTSNWVNFIAQTPITSPTIFKVKLWKLSHGCLCLGVGTQSMFGVHNYHEIEFVNYDFELKQIAVSEKKINAPSMARDGSIITVKCDPRTFRVQWACDDKQIGTAIFPQQIRSQELYLIAYFKNANDELEIWQE